MEVINYAASGQNMSLPDDAQFIQGVSGSACYLINGEGKVQLTGGNMAIFTLSIWRRWDGIVEADKPRPFFKFKNFKVFFNGNTDILNIAIQNDTVLQTAVKDDKNFNHWVFVFARNKFLTVYKNTKEVFKTPTDDTPVDLSEPFILGGDFTHATFDEFSIFDNELSKDHIDGLYQFISRGTNLSNVEGLINESVPQHTPHYLGTVKTAPDGARVNIFLGRKNGFNDANIGDWILIIEPIAGYKRGWCYRWQGASWAILDPPERYIQEYTACIKDQLELKDMFSDTKFFGAILCQYLGFNEAVGKSLTANKIFVDNFVTKKLLVDHDPNDPTDFELAINRDVGMLAKNNGERIFEVTPTGNIFAKNAFLQDGTFTGEIITDSFELRKATEDVGLLLNFPKNTATSTIYKASEYGTTNVDCRIFYKNKERNVAKITASHSYWQYDKEDLSIGVAKYFYYVDYIVFQLTDPDERVEFSAGHSQKWEYGYDFGSGERHASSFGYWDHSIPFEIKAYEPNRPDRIVVFKKISKGKSTKPGLTYYHETGGRKYLCIT